jgi:outer membrane immunogenic protein
VSYTPNDSATLSSTCSQRFAPGRSTCVRPATFGIGGGFGGFQAGYNWQSNRWLAGVEADFDWAAIKGNGTSNFTLEVFPANYQATENIKWFGTVRARLGWLPTDNLLLYGTGGLAYGRVEAGAILNTQRCGRRICDFR